MTKIINPKQMRQSPRYLEPLVIFRLADQPLAEDLGFISVPGPTFGSGTELIRVILSTTSRYLQPSGEKKSLDTKSVLLHRGDKITDLSRINHFSRFD
jgi:hypothetical protein